MQLLPDLKKIRVKEISRKSNWDLHPFLSSLPTDHQLSTVAAMGLIHPPVVIEQLNNDKEVKYHLLSDQQWFEAYHRSFPEKTDITVLALSHELSRKDILQYLLYYKLIMCNFSPMEKAYFFTYCLKSMSIKDVAKSFLPQLNEKAHPHTITKYTSLTMLETALQDSIHSEQLTPKMGLELLALPTKDRMKLHKLFEQLEFGGGKQKRLLALCKDLAGRKNTSIAALLKDEQYTDILEHKEMNRPQKGANILSSLYKQLFPESNKAEEGFTTRVKRMELPSSCKTTHSPAFEKDEVVLSITFPTLTALEEKIPTIKELF